MIPKSKLISTEILIYKALNDMDISHEEFTKILNEKAKYDRMKHKIINENEKNIQIESCMYLCIKMESYCLKCTKYTKNINSQVSITSNGKLMILSKMQYVIVKNLNLLIKKKQKDC